MQSQQAESNPFVSFLGRLLQTPLRALELPAEIRRRVLGAPSLRRERAASELQKQLSERVGGAPVEQNPFAGLQNAGSLLSLGLIPRADNPNQINPFDLEGESADRFNSLTALQQKLASARNPQDFSSLLNDDTLFGERQPGTAIGALNKDVDQGFVTPEQRDIQFQKRLGEGQQIVDPLTGRVVAENEPNGEHVETFFDRLNPGELLRLGYSVRSSQAAFESNDSSLLRFDQAALSRKLDAIKAKDFPDQNSLRGQYLQQLKPFAEVGQNYRRFIVNYGESPNDIPEDVRADLEAAGVDVSSIDPSAIRDVALIFSFMKGLDPGSTVRESEFAMAESARAFGFGADTIRKLLSGEKLRPEQRSEIFRVVKDQFESQIRGHDQLRERFSAIASERGWDPELITPDLLGDIRGSFDSFSSAGSPRDGESIKAAFLEQGGDPEDAEGFREFAIDAGFRPKSAKSGR